MIGYLISKEDNGKSKKVIFKDLDGEETKYLVNGIDDLSIIPLNRVYQFIVDGSWRNIPIIVSMTEVIESDDPDVDMLKRMYGPKRVPKLGEIFPMMVEFINSTPDESNNYQPRQVTEEQFRDAVTKFLEDEDGVNRLSKLVICPASLKYHDAQNGGLLRHIAKMEEMYIRSFAPSKFHEYEVHPLLVCTAILFHDMGKIDQYEYDPALQEWKYAEYASYRGNHIGICLERWARKGREVCKILGLPDGAYWDIWHLIGSHHGPTELNLGSLMNPFGHDAWTLYGLDYTESRQEEVFKFHPKEEE